MAAADVVYLKSPSVCLCEPASAPVCECVFVCLCRAVQGSLACACTATGASASCSGPDGLPSCQSSPSTSSTLSRALAFSHRLSPPAIGCVHWRARPLLGDANRQSVVTFGDRPSRDTLKARLPAVTEGSGIRIPYPGSRSPRTCSRIRAAWESRPRHDPR